MVNEIQTGIQGSLKSTVAEDREHDVPIMAKRIVEVPSNLQARWAYDSNSMVEYAGYAAKGVSESTNGWLLQKFTYNATLLATKREIAYDSWDNYASASYS